MLLAVRISSYGCIWEVWRALKKLGLLSAAPRATLTHFLCSPNFPSASLTRYTHAKHEKILKSFTPLYLPLNQGEVIKVSTGWKYQERFMSELLNHERYHFCNCRQTFLSRNASNHSERRLKVSGRRIERCEAVELRNFLFMNSSYKRERIQTNKNFIIKLI